MDKLVSVEFAGQKKINVEIDGIIVETDQSPENGGGGSAPEPFQHFLAAIASCTALYALEFCSARDISTEGMGFRMICRRDEKLKRYTEIALELTLPRGFPEKFRGAITRAMDLCAVKRHLLNSPEFEIKTISSEPAGKLPAQSV